MIGDPRKQIGHLMVSKRMAKKQGPLRHQRMIDPVSRVRTRYCLVNPEERYDNSPLLARFK